MSSATTEGTAEQPIKIERFERKLRVELTEHEIAERARRSAYLLGEIDQRGDEMDAAKKQAKAQIEVLEAEMRQLSLEVRDGGTYREVPCERRFNYRLGKVEEYRCDIKDAPPLTERAMTDRERQLELEIQGKPAAPKRETTTGADDGIVDDDYDGTDDSEDMAEDDGAEAHRSAVDDFDVDEDPPTDVEDLPTQKKRGRKAKPKAD